MTGRLRWVAGLAGIAAFAAFGGLEAENLLRIATEDASEAAASPAIAPQHAPGAITALGRLEPKDGVLRVAGPSQPVVVISKLFIDDGDPVKEGQVIAILDSHAARQAAVDRLQVELENARTELRRHERLFRDKIVSDSELEQWQVKVRTLEAELAQARAELDLTVVHSPITGQVLEVHAREGERVAADGIAELGQTQAMYAVAEVYETDIRRVKVGQRATVSSPALSGAIGGTVDRIGLKIGKKDVLDTDPAARIDARVVEVEILLDDSPRVAGLTNLQVEVAIEP